MLDTGSRSPFALTHADQERLAARLELALRRAAQTVDDQMVDVMRRQGIEGPWAAGERILVLIAGDPMASALVRAGRRLADLMDTPWTVANVERPNRPNRDPNAARRVTEALKLAEQLGGASVVLTGDDLPDAVLAFAGRGLLVRWRLHARPPETTAPAR